MSQHEPEQIMHRYKQSTDQKPSEAVYYSVAALEDCSPLELTPLAEVVDPEALDAILTDNAETQISFYYCGYEVTATPTEIRIQESDKR